MRKKLLTHIILSLIVCLSASNLFAMEERLPIIDREFLGLSDDEPQKMFCSRLQHLAHILMFQEYFLSNAFEYKAIYESFEAVEKESRRVMGPVKSLKPFDGGVQIVCNIEPPLQSPEAVITVLRHRNKVMGLDCKGQDMPFVAQLLASSNPELVRLGHIIRTKIDAQEQFRIFMRKTLPVLGSVSCIKPSVFENSPAYSYISAFDDFSKKVHVLKAQTKIKDVNAFKIKKLEKQLNTEDMQDASRRYVPQRDLCRDVYKSVVDTLYQLGNKRDLAPHKRIVGDSQNNFLPRSLDDDFSFIEHIYANKRGEKAFDRSLVQCRPDDTMVPVVSAQLSPKQMREGLNQLPTNELMQAVFEMAQTLQRSNDPRAAQQLRNLQSRLQAASGTQLSPAQPLQLKEKKKSEPQLTRKQLMTRYAQQKKQEARQARLEQASVQSEEQVDDVQHVSSQMEDVSLQPSDLYPKKKKKKKKKGNKGKEAAPEGAGPELPIAQEADAIISSDANMITILDRRNHAQLCLYASESDRRPQMHSGINYSQMIKQWFAKPEEVLALKGYADPSNGQWCHPYTMEAPTTDHNSLRRLILIHNFSKLVDRYIRTHGICGNIQSRIHEEQENISITIPGHVMHLDDDTRENCLYAYFISKGLRNSIDQRSKWYHRNIDFRPDLVNEFLDQGHYTVQFPALESSSSSSLRSV